MAEKVDVKKAYEAIARILGDRYNVKVTLAGIKKREETTQEKTA